MYSIYKKNEVLFAVLWIFIYCLVTIPIRGQLGDESIYMLISLAIIAVSITVFIKKYDLEKNMVLINGLKILEDFCTLFLFGF